MKLVSVSIFIILLLTQTFSQWLLIGEFNINQGFIAGNLCINKTKPKLHCNGKCQLMKKMAEEEQQNNNGSKGSDLRLKFQDVLFTCLKQSETFQCTANLLLTYTGFMESSWNNIDPAPVFHPPARS